MNKILIAEPIYSAMPPSVYFNRIAFWREVFANPTYVPRPLVIGPRNGIRYARDRAIRAALELKASHLLFMDDDILVPSHILNRLLAVGQPIVGGLVHRDNGDPLVFKRALACDSNFGGGTKFDIGEPIFEELVWLDHPKTGEFECAAIAAGCMLIQTSVLAAMQDKRWLFNYDETDRSMDVNFCREARAHGFTVWCWPDEPCEQIEHYGK